MVVLLGERAAGPGRVHLVFEFNPPQRTESQRNLS